MFYPFRINSLSLMDIAIIVSKEIEGTYRQVVTYVRT